MKASTGVPSLGAVEIGCQFMFCLPSTAAFAVRPPLHVQPETTNAQIPIRLAARLSVIAAVVATESRLNPEAARIVDRDAQTVCAY